MDEADESFVAKLLDPLLDTFKQAVRRAPVLVSPELGEHKQNVGRRHAQVVLKFDELKWCCFARQRKVRIAHTP